MNLSTNFSSGEIDMKSPLHKNSFSNNNFEESDTYVRHTKQNNKKLVKILFCIIFCLTALLIAFIVLYCGLYDNRNWENRTSNYNSKYALFDTKEICKTTECVQISARMIEAMDTKEDPCKDFYRYACGGWLKSTPIPDSRMRYSRFEKLAEDNNVVIRGILNNLIKRKRKATTPSLKKAATYYETCMDTKKIEATGDKPVKELLKKIGSWSVIDADFNATNWNALDVLIKVQRNLSQSALLNMYVSGDIKHSDQNVVMFDQSGISLSRYTYLGNSSYHQKRRRAYVKMMKAVVKELGANDSGVQLMEDVFEFEKQLANVTMSVMERRDYKKIYKSMTLQKFANKTEIPLRWLKKFVDGIFADTGHSVPVNERIVSFSTNYIREAYKMFYNLSEKVQSAYLMWHSVEVMVPEVLGRYKEIIDEYQMEVSGTKVPSPRWEVCVTGTLRVFADALARPFVKDVYDSTAKTMSTEMIHAIKNVFKSNLDSMEWMDEATKKYAKEKATVMLENIGYPDFIMNNTMLEAKYRGLEVTKGQYFKNYMAQMKFRNLKNYFKRGKPVDKSEWGIPPTDVNAYYAPTENKIGFTAGILQWPFYDKRAPRAVAYGAIGMVVGHEVSHGFDDQGKDFTIQGNFDTWWTNHSAREFEKKARCFVDQYSNFSMFGVNVFEFFGSGNRLRGQAPIKGEQTLGENLADNGGLRQSFQAYQQWTGKNGEEKRLPGLDLTPEQLYFLAFAQVWCTAYREPGAISQIETGFHTLSNFRVIGTLQNSKEFSSAYKCPIGSYMNPAKKCRIW